MPIDGLILGIDLGGTNMQIGVVGADDALLSQAKRKTKAEQGADAVLDRMADGAREACDAANLRFEDLAGVGLGAPGALDHRTGVVFNAPNLGWRDFNVAEALRSRLGRPVAVENDVNAALFGENRLGVGGNAFDALGVWVGTGVGGALILRGELYHGGMYTAGEIGHMTLFPGAPLGWRKLEEACSRTAVAERIAKQARAGRPTSIHDESPGAIERVKSKAIARAYAGGDELTREIVNEAADLLGVGIGSAVTLLSVPIVILGGGLTEAIGAPFVDRLAEAARANVFPDAVKQVRVMESELRDAAGIHGAAILARERLDA